MFFGILAMLMTSAFTVVANQSSISATPSAILFYSWGQGTNTVSKIEGGSNTATWAAATGGGAATGIAADATYVYWAQGKKVYRQSISASSGSTSVATFIDITGWSEGGMGARTIRSIAVDNTHVYIMGSRGYDGTSVLRASKTTGLQDSTWFWELSGGAEGHGLTVDKSVTGAVFAQWGNAIAKATKTSTSNVPTTATRSWNGTNVANNNSGADPVPLTNDGTYLYFRNSTGGVNRALMSSSSPAGGENISQSIPSGNIRGLSIDEVTGTLYFDSSTGSSNTYTIYSVVPDANNPQAPNAFATFSSSSGSLNALVSVPAPASAPIITTQPAATSITIGQSGSVSVVATSPDGGTLSYQWRKNGTDISGAISSSYSITNAVSGDAGTYSVVVTNTLGSSTASTTSSAVTVATTQPTTTTTATTEPAVAPTTTVAPVANTTTTVPATTTTTTTTTTVPAGAPVLVTEANRAQLEAAPGSAVAVINGKAVAVETVKVEATATPADLQAVAKDIVNDIANVLPAGVKNPIAVVNTPEGAELSGLMVNPDDPKEKLSVSVDSVTLIKAGESRVLISALNQTNLPGEVAPGGVLQVTRGGIVAAQAFGLPGNETGEIVLMSTPRLLQTFTVNGNGSFNGQVALPKNIAFGSHTVVMATKSAKVSLGINLVRTRMEFRIKRVIGTTIFKNRAKVVKKGGGRVTVTGAGRCKANSTRVVMSAKPGACYITVKQAAKGANKPVYYRFTVSVVKKAPKKVTSSVKK